MRSRLATRAGPTIAEAAGSHAIYISKPEAVALIAKAAKNVSSQMSVNSVLLGRTFPLLEFQF